jgi:two-component system cell cycle sensor histidine kinase/response regulator CckA
MKETTHEPDVQIHARILASVPQSVVVADPQGRVIYWNEGAQKLLGYSAQEALGRHVFFLHPEKLHPWIESEVIGPLLSRGTHLVELPAIHRSGEEVWILLSLAVLRGDDGAVAGMVGVSTDITEKKRLERAIRTLVEGGAAQVGERFFTATARQLAEILGVEIVLLGEYPGSTREAVRALAMSVDGDIQEDFDLPLKGSPCEQAIHAGACRFARGLRAAFPEDPTVARLGVHSCIGLRLSDSQGQILGLVMAASRREMQATDFARSVLQVFAPRISAEIERRRNEERLRRLTHILEATSDLVGTSTPEGRILYLNRAGRRMLGLDEAVDLSSLSMADVYPPTTLRRIVKEHLPVANREGTCSFESSIRQRDGQELPVSQVLIAHHGPQGQVEFYSTILRDLSAQRRAAERLRESEARHRALFETMAQGVVYQDAAGHIIAANPAAERILGLTLDQMMGRTSVDPRWRAIHEDGSPFPGETHPAMVALQSGKPAHAIMGVFNPLENTTRWIDVHATPQFRPKEERPYQVFATFTDLTERLQAEAERESLKEQLAQSQKMEAVGRLAGGVAHDFNNLLTAIRGFAEVIRESLGPDHPSRADLEEILQASTRAAGLTQQLLAFGRKQIVAPRTLNLNAAIEASRRMLERLIGEDVTIEVQWAPDLWPVRMDPNQLDQVLVNLAANARDAMPEGGRLLWATANLVLDEAFLRGRPQVQPGDYVRLSVSDTGVGMDARTRERIFEPFFTTKETGKGTGLGLATVYGIVSQNGGFIDVLSEPGKGTTFEIYLPRSTSEGEQAPQAPGASSLHGTETILLVEDEESVRRLARRVLVGKGYQVLEAETVDHALHIARTHPGKMDLLVTDVVMPGLNGLALYRRLLEWRPGLKVLFMSGHNENVITRHGVLDEGLHFLPKPFRVEDLASKVRAVLDETDQAGRPPQKPR